MSCERNCRPFTSVICGSARQQGSESEGCRVQVDGSVEYEWTQAATDGALAVPNPLDTAPDNTLQGLTALIYNLLTQDTSQQGSALNTLSGLVADSADRSLFLLNGDVCYARCLHQYSH